MFSPGCARIAMRAVARLGFRSLMRAPIYTFAQRRAQMPACPAARPRHDHAMIVADP